MIEIEPDPISPVLVPAQLEAAASVGMVALRLAEIENLLLFHGPPKHVVDHNLDVVE